MRTFLVTGLTLAITALGATAGPVAAAPASTLTVDCRGVSSGFQSWIGIHATNLACSHAAQTARAWSSNCSYPNPLHGPSSCSLGQHYGTHSVHYTCSSLGRSGPRHYEVHCASAHDLHKVSFTYFPHGFSRKGRIPSSPLEFRRWRVTLDAPERRRGAPCRTVGPQARLD